MEASRLKTHAAICFGIAFLFFVILLFSPRSHLGFFGNLAFLVSATFFTTIGVYLGDAFRRFVKPDVVFTSGAMETFKTKILWLVGPQAIGWFIGYMATSGFMKSVLGYYGF